MTAKKGHLVIKFDGASRGNPGPAAIGVLIEDEAGRILLQLSNTIGRATNNQAEYKALIAALEYAARMGAKSVDMRSDSELVVRQIQGQYKVRNRGLKPLFEKAQQLLSKFEEFSISSVPRYLNSEADRLAKQAFAKGGASGGEPFDIKPRL